MSSQGEPRIALDLLSNNPERAVVQVEPKEGDFGLDEINRQLWGCITVTVRQWTEQRQRLRKAVFVHKYPRN